MKRISFVTVVFVLIALAAPSRASELFPNSRFKLGYDGEYLFYDQPGLMHIKGFLHGGFGAWTGYFTDNHLMVGLEGSILNGVLRYKGSTASGDSVKFNTENVFAEGRVLVGKGFDCGGIGVTPFTGFGVRNWYNRLEFSPGYSRNITHYYLPLGVNVAVRLKNDWSVGASLEGDVLLSGSVKTELSDAIPGIENPHTHQKFGNGCGLRLGTFAEYDFGGFSFGVEPYFRYWHFAKTDTDDIINAGSTVTLYEPENDFYQYGLRTYIAF